jgi:hypothetical protein
MNNGLVDLVNHTVSRRNGPRSSEVRGPRFYDDILKKNNEERHGPRSPPRSEAEVPAEVRGRE